MERDATVAYLTRVITNPIGSLDKNSDFIQSWREAKDSKVVTMVSKMNAVDNLCTILGYYEAVKVEAAIERKCWYYSLNLREPAKRREIA